MATNRLSELRRFQRLRQEQDRKHQLQERAAEDLLQQIKYDNTRRPLPSISFSAAVSATIKRCFSEQPEEQELWFGQHRLIYEIWHTAAAHQDLLCCTPWRQHLSELINIATRKYIPMIWRPRHFPPDDFGFFRKDYL